MCGSGKTAVGPVAWVASGGVQVMVDDIIR